MEKAFKERVVGPHHQWSHPAWVFLYSQICGCVNFNELVYRSLLSTVVPSSAVKEEKVDYILDYIVWVRENIYLLWSLRGHLEVILHSRYE